MPRGACEPRDGEVVVLGEIVGIYGVQGWVKVYSWTRPAANILSYPEWLLSAPAGEWQAFQVRGARQLGKSLIAQFDDIHDRHAARAFIGRRVAVPRAALPATEPGEYYWSDLTGLRVSNAAGVEFGRVDGLIDTGANDVLVVSGERERLIPFVPGVYVTVVDVDGGRIEVDWNPED